MRFDPNSLIVIPALDAGIHAQPDLESVTMYVYILASKPYGTLYIGVTNDLIRRIHEHKSKFAKSFTSRYDINMLVYFEQLDDPENAIRREKQLKDWNREWKLRLIESMNPDWQDLYPTILGWPPVCMDSGVKRRNDN